MRICIFSPFFLCLDEHGFFVHIYTAAHESREIKKKPYRAQRRVDPERHNFLNVAGQRCPKLYLIKIVGPGASVLGMKSFSPQYSYMKFSPYIDFGVCVDNGLLYAIAMP